MLAMTLVGNELSKEQSTADSGLMTVKGTDLPVQVASSDMVVGHDGQLMMRSRTSDWDDHCTDGHCDANGTTGRRALQSDAVGSPIRTASTPATIVPLSSDMPVEYFHTMENLLVDDHQGLSLNFKVLSGGRMPASWASSGNGYVMVMHTIAGRVIVDGMTMHFDKEMSAALEGHGLELEPETVVLPSGGAGRRLQIDTTRDDDHDARRRLQATECNEITDSRQCNQNRFDGRRACSFNARRRRRRRRRAGPDGCSAKRWYSAAVAVANAPPPPPEECMNEHNQVGPRAVIIKTLLVTPICYSSRGGEEREGGGWGAERRRAEQRRGERSGAEAE